MPTENLKSAIRNQRRRIENPDFYRATLGQRQLL